MESMNNLYQIQINNMILYVSYSTIIAFSNSEGYRFVSENIWSNVTGKHMNSLCDKKSRIKHDEFKKLLSEEMSKNGISHFKFNA